MKQLDTESKEDHLSLFDNEGYDPISYITSDQQKYARYVVSTSLLSRRQLALKLGVTEYTLKKWEKNPHIQNYLYLLRKEIHNTDVISNIQAQGKILQDLAFHQFLERFEDPNPDRDLPRGASDEEKRRYAERFVKNASAKDMARIYEVISKNVKDEARTGSATESVFIREVEKIRENYGAKISRDRQERQALSEKGFDPTKSLQENIREMKKRKQDGVIDITPGSERKSHPEEDLDDDYTIEVERSFSIERVNIVGSKKDGQ